PSGKLLKPMLALHDSGDPLVVASTAFAYALIVQRAGHAANFVQQYVNAEGHCVFTPVQVARAFDELVEWSAGGTRPESGRLR
ncbi:MAG: alpha/beta hydrolase, partial [Dokdonella sp.]